MAPSDNRLPQATDEALAFLSGEERTILSAYYLDGRTLAEIARMLGVHESTISRKLDKLAKSLRKQIWRGSTDGVCLAGRQKKRLMWMFVICK